MREEVTFTTEDELWKEICQTSLRERDIDYLREDIGKVTIFTWYEKLIVRSKPKT